VDRLTSGLYLYAEEAFAFPSSISTTVCPQQSRRAHGGLIEIKSYFPKIFLMLRDLQWCSRKTMSKALGTSLPMADLTRRRRSRRITLARGTSKRVMMGLSRRRGRISQMAVRDHGQWQK
jgi:hypothetical protein